MNFVLFVETVGKGEVTEGTNVIWCMLMKIVFSAPACVLVSERFELIVSAAGPKPLSRFHHR
jgi:hypothetical protein